MVGHMKRRIVDDDSGGAANTPAVSTGVAAATQLSTGIEKYILPSGLFLYRYRLSSFPPNVQEHDQLSQFLGKLISKLMVATGTRMEPFMCIDGRHLDEDFFTRLRESGTTWRPLLGFPLIPGFHPFRFLPIAYHIKGRDAWNEVAERFLGTGGTGIYLTSLPADEFMIRLIQLLFIRDGRGSTDVFPLYLPDIVLGHMEKAVGPAIEKMLESFQFFVGENPAAASVDIVSRPDIQELVVATSGKSQG
jgi:hypothetical protein